jgi:hypothetical protein
MEVFGVLERECKRGPVEPALSELRRVVGAYAREGRWAHIKVGYTSNLYARWQHYQRSGYQALVPVYRTTSWKNAVRIEEELISYLGEISSTSPWLYNIASGRNGRRAEYAYEYFTYLALGRRYSRIRE